MTSRAVAPVSLPWIPPARRFITFLRLHQSGSTTCNATIRFPVFQAGIANCFLLYVDTQETKTRNYIRNAQSLILLLEKQNCTEIRILRETDIKELKCNPKVSSSFSNLIHTSCSAKKNLEINFETVILFKVTHLLGIFHGMQRIRMKIERALHNICHENFILEMKF